MWCFMTGVFDLSYFIFSSMLSNVINSSSFLIIAELNPTYKFATFYLLSIDDYLGYCYFFIIVNSTAVNIHIQVFVCICFYFSWEYIKERLCFIFWETAKHVSHYGCTFLRSHQQCMSNLISHILTNTCYFLLFKNNCDFDLYFPGDQWYWAFCHVFINQLYIIFG